jgi:hypothetical protein
MECAGSNGKKLLPAEIVALLVKALIESNPAWAPSD